MNDKLPINSVAWWNEYFREEWSRHGGSEQTSHFAQRLLAGLPEADQRILARLPLSVLDWGCALGEGCAELAAAWPQARLTGMDIAEEALRQARARHPHLRFLASSADQPPGTLPERFDVVVNSNSIEHFDDWLGILRNNLAQTRLLHLTLVPYREEPLSIHHRHSFDESSFPPEVAGFSRIFERVIAVDTRYWPSGRQLLVGYATPAYLRLRESDPGTLAERAKWEAYYAGLPVEEIDPLSRQFNAELTAVLQELLPAGGRLLEAGAGGGNQSIALAQAGFDVTLLDFSPAALEYARRNFERHGLNAGFIEGDAFEPKTPEYDLVFNAGVLEHYALDEQARFLRGMASRSRRYVLVLIPNRACYWYWAWRTHKAAEHDWPFGREVPQTSLADAFDAAGLRYVGQCYLGEAWTEYFIESLPGIDGELRAQLLRLHRSPVVPAINRGYLMAALGVVGEADSLVGRWQTTTLPAAELRRNEEWTAIVADALAGRIGAEQAALRARIESEREHQRTQDQAQTRMAELTVKLQQVRIQEQETRLQLQARLDELNVAAGRLAELGRQVEEVSAWGRSSAERAGQLQQRLSDLEAAERRRWGNRLRQGLRVLREESPRQWARRIWWRLPLSPGQRHRIGLALRRLQRDQPASGGANGAAVLPVHAPLRTGNGSDVFVFAVIDWHFRIQRPQQIARALAAAGQRVFYVSNQFVDASSAGYAVEELDPELPLYQVRLHAGGAPPIYFATPAQATLEQLRDGLARLLQAARPARCIGLIDHVWWWPLANMLPNSLRVYDCMDHHEGFGNVPSGLLTLEDEVVREADVVITTSAWLAERLRGKRAQVALVRNACDPVHFGAPPPALHADPQGRRTIGYFGAIAEWFDVALLRSVALAHPGARVLLVGNDTVGAAAALAHCSNVEFTGEVPYAELPRYVHAFDVCLLPFKVLPLTLATNPVKVYEYLAAGKPVVAVDLPEVRQFGALVRAAGTPGDFVAAVTAALDEPQSGARIEERQHFALGQTWANRAAAVTAAIAAHQPPRVSVVVLTWNNLALTQACLASLAASDYPDLELIIVDNASTDGSRTWLREYAQAQSQAQLVLNDRNLGFAAGNNIGLARATGEFVVVLNNDTQVTPGWVRTLLRHFERNPRLGLAGPVTNNIGNEAKIDIAYDDRAQMLERAADYTLAHAGRVHPMRTSAFFCVMMRAAALREVGALCEDYGLGFFEDDDYCRRLEAAGWHIVCAEDVFVHHELSASFAKLPSAERQQLFDRNLALYESKWGKWQPHQHRAPSSATVES